MRVLRGLHKGFWAGIILIGLAVVVWFIAPGAKSCVTDLDTTACETIWVIVLNVIGLVLFVIGAMCITVSSAVSRNKARRELRVRSEDTR